jgi:hypothetical protein
VRALARVGLVIGGFLVAFAVAAAAVSVRVALTSGPDAQASAGMHGFGDALLFLAVFGTVALVPAGLTLYWLWTARARSRQEPPR